MIVFSAALEHTCPECGAVPGHGCVKQVFLLFTCGRTPHVSRLHLATKTPEIIRAMIESMRCAEVTRNWGIRKKKA